MKKLKIYKKFKTQKKMSDEELLNIYNKLSFKDKMDLLKSILQIGIFSIEGKFMTKIGIYSQHTKKRILTKLSNYNNYKDSEKYSNGFYLYGVDRIGILTKVEHLLTYTFKDERDIRFHMFKVIKLTKICI